MIADLYQTPAAAACYLKREREKGRLIQRKLAAHLGLNESAVSMWLQRGDVPPKYFPRIAKFLDLSLEEFAVRAMQLHRDKGVISSTPPAARGIRAHKPSKRGRR